MILIKIRDKKLEDALLKVLSPTIERFDKHFEIKTPVLTTDDEISLLDKYLWGEEPVIETKGQFLYYLKQSKENSEKLINDCEVISEQLWNLSCTIDALIRDMEEQGQKDSNPLQKLSGLEFCLRIMGSQLANPHFNKLQEIKNKAYNLLS